MRGYSGGNLSALHGRAWALVKRVAQASSRLTGEFEADVLQRMLHPHETGGFRRQVALATKKIRAARRSQ